MGRLIQDGLLQFLQLGRVFDGVAIATAANGQAFSDQCVDPVQAADANLPHGQRCAGQYVESSRAIAAVRLLVDGNVPAERPRMRICFNRG